MATLSKGSSGTAVRALQEKLNVVNAGLVDPVAVTGTYDSDTVYAVRMFEADVGLPVDGSMDSEDMEALEDRLDEIAESEVSVENGQVSATIRGGSSAKWWLLGIVAVATGVYLYKKHGSKTARAEE